tara:strand:- start:6234 stop:7136 length:903 start_codon:yes stop_codon:yes gene_type:complete
MNNELATIDTNNFAAMAAIMGIASEETSSKRSTLPRLRMIHSGIMGEAEIKGKKMKMEVIPGGSYKLEIPEGNTYYASNVHLRTFMQRFMYKRFVKGDVNSSNRFVKTVMATSLTNDLKDNDGGFNCGKPSGWIKDFKALPAATQDLIRQIKRTRVIFGKITLVDPTDEKGVPVNVESMSVIWEVDNRTAFKTLGDLFGSMAKRKRLPVQYSVDMTSSEVPLPNGSSYFVPEVDIDLDDTIDLIEEDQATFASFREWSDSYNEYIMKTWSEKNVTMSQADTALADDLGAVFEQEEEGVPF